MQHSPASPQLRVLVLQRMECMGVGRKDAIEIAGRDGGDVLFGKRRPETLLSRPANVAPGGLLAVLKDAEVGPTLPQDLRQGAIHSLVARIEGGEIADIPEQVGRLLTDVFD